MAEKYTREADLCTDFLTELPKIYEGWTAYPETCGFDIMLAHHCGIQIGIEAKLRLNGKVVSQVLPWRHDCGVTGPDFRAVLVPSGTTSDLLDVCAALGVTVLRFNRDDIKERYRDAWNTPIRPGLPDPDRRYFDDREWHDWCPLKRCKLPDYIPDVQAGMPSPVQLSDWKIKAIKLMIILDERPVTRADFKALGLSPTRWTDAVHGWLVKGDGGYVKTDHTPDLRRAHPTNYAEIEADKETWATTLPKFQPVGVSLDLFASGGAS